MKSFKTLAANIMLLLISPALILGTAELSIRMFAAKRVKTYFDGQTELWIGDPVPAKQAGEYRIVIFGGSSAYGFPVADRYSIAAWLKKSFPYLIEGKKVSVINCGWPGKASHQVREGVRYMLQYKPDLYILYDGHNETPIANRLYVDHPLYRLDLMLYFRSALYRFLQMHLDRLRKKILYGHSGHVEKNYREDLIAQKIYKHPEVTDADYQKILDRYRKNTEWSLRFARRHGIDVVMIVPPSNLHDIPPFASAHREGMTAEEITAWQAAFDQGKKSQTAGNLQSALTIYQAAEKIDPRYAELSYRLGQVYEGMGEYELARRYFIQARDLDARPWRAKTLLLELNRQLAEKYQLILVDGDKLFRDLSTNGVIGASLVSDDVHPTVQGQQVLTDAILRELQAHDKIVPAGEWNWGKFENFRSAPGNTEWQVDGSDNAYRHVLTGLILWQQKRYKEAILDLEKGLILMPQFLESEAFLGDAYFRTGNREKAKAAFDLLEKKNPSLKKLLAEKYPDVGESLHQLENTKSRPALTPAA